jgi:hypothetical protein
VEFDALVDAGLAEMLQVEAIVVIGKEAGAAIIAPLGDVEGYSRKFKSWPSRHVCNNLDCYSSQL